jgi:hypothetical protein
MKSAAQRKRKERERQRLGRAVLRIEVEDIQQLVHYLCWNGLLREEDRDDPRAIEDAAGRALYRLCAHARIVKNLYPGPGDRRGTLLDAKYDPAAEWALIKKKPAKG